MIFSLPARFFVISLILTAAATSHAQTTDSEGLAFFEQRVRPVLVEKCYGCHSAEARSSQKLKGGLLLDTAAGLLAGGDSGPAVIAGKPAESLLLKALKYDGLEMPPNGKLGDNVIADFVKWIEIGAPDPRQGEADVKPKREINLEEGRRFWSYQPLKAVTLPEVKQIEWSQTPIDRFVAAKHEELHLQPSGSASPETLLRRVYFDLIGLPPSPEQLTAFLGNSSPDALENVVDELLRSHHYGERWARHWLDAARFAESGGYEFDAFRPGAFHYRDWVIRALNGDMPYPEFVRMQIAGDQLMPNDLQGAAATGFLVAGPYPGQITAKTVERIRYDQLDDMIMTIGGSMLGLTLGCVRCHEHKYDPIPHADYYGIAAALAQTAHGPKQFDSDPAATLRAVEKHQADQVVLNAALKKYATEHLPQRFAAWQQTELPKQPLSQRWQVMEPVTFDAERSWQKLLPGYVLAHDGGFSPESNAKRRTRPTRSTEDYVISTHTFQRNLTSLRLDFFAEKSLPSNGPGLNGDGSFQLVELQVTARALDPASPERDKPTAWKLIAVNAAAQDPDQPLVHAVDGKPETAWVVRSTAKKDNAAIFEIEGGWAGFAGGTELTVTLQFRDLGVGRLRLALSTEPNPATWAGDISPQHVGEIRAILAANNNQVPPPFLESLAQWFSPFDSETAQVYHAARDHAQQVPRPLLTEVYTTIHGGQDVFFLRRGEVDNKQGKAEPAFLQVLMPVADAKRHWLPQPATDARIGLANWMTDVDHGAGALLARVMVNRVWQHHFGEGLVGTPNDFGSQGERPSHPELLEWLASEFVRGGWKLKPLHKAIILTRVYQLANDVTPENLKLDPENRYLWYHKPQRLEAEIIRDALLAVGGSLDTTMYGPSLLDNTPRRSIYLRVKRSELIPFLTMFDAPEPTQSIGERIATTLPTQALTMMNSPFVRQQAEKLAARVRPAADVPLETAIDRAYQIAFSRLPSVEERTRMLAFVQPQTDANLAFVEFCQVLLCLNEFVYVD